MEILLLSIYQMKKPIVILMLIAFAAVCASQVEVDLTLSNSNDPIRVTVPEGAFQTIDNQEDIAPLGIEANARIAPSEFEVESEYEQFRNLWDIDSPGAIQEQRSLTADLFEKCLATADYLGIQGEYAIRFAENMVKYGLLGTHSADIVSTVVFSDCDLAYNTFWDLFYAFLGQIEFEYKITHPNEGYTVLEIENINLQFKHIDKEYTGPSQTTRMRTVLYSSLGPEGSSEKERNEAVFVWLLLNTGGSSVDVQYLTNLSSEDTSEVTQTIEVFTKKNEKGRCVYVEGLNLGANYRNNSFLTLSLQRVPDLSRLRLFITTCYNSPYTDLSSLFDCISSCKSLKSLELSGKMLESVEIVSLVECFPHIEQLKFSCEILKGAAIDSLKKCTQIQKLEMYGKPQPSAVVQALASHLPALKNLMIRCQPLDLVAAKSFEACKNLEKLYMHGKNQPSAVMQELVSHLSSLKYMSINCKVLGLVATKSFEVCTQLEILEIGGEVQPSAAVQNLVSCIPSLKELKITCKVLELVAAKSFKLCTRLEKLEMCGEKQPSVSVQELVRHLPSIKDMNIKSQALELAAAESFEICTRLEKLEIYGEQHTCATLQALVSHIPSLKYLTIVCQPLDPQASDSFKICKNLEKLSIFGTGSVSFLIRILEILPSLQDLKIEIDSADLAFADTLRKFSNLRHLDLAVREYTPGALAHYLQDPLPKLKCLKVFSRDINNKYSEEDNKAVEGARIKGMSICL
ncbi:hypothetical protein NECID01_2139 [Nematocida sp. AWRm77]|nr:hypothetical protein NECID01_2139 [Nematocida sp. AWRm77]